MADDPGVSLHMPEKIDIQPALGMAPEQKKYYDAAKDELLNTLVKQPGNIELEDEEEGSEKPKSNVLVQLMRMRQIAITPELVDTNYTGPAPKIEEAVNAINTHLEAHPERGVVVFSDFNETFPILKRELLKSQGDNAVGQFTEADFGDFHGGIPQKKRDENAVALNSGKLKVLFVNNRAGGVGQNWQQNANMVVHLNSPWNPATLRQATARVHRQGQERKTYVFHPHMEDSVDDKIAALLASKEKASAQVLGDESVKQQKTMRIGSTLGTDELMKLLQEDTGAKKAKGKKGAK